MNPSTLCLSLDKSKKLVELGLVVESYFDWYYWGDGWELTHREIIPKAMDLTPAPTLQELLEVMPRVMWFFKQYTSELIIGHDSACYQGKIDCEMIQGVHHNHAASHTGSSPIEALGDLAIYLLREGLWKP